MISAQFFCEAKTTLESKIYYLKNKIAEEHNRKDFTDWYCQIQSSVQTCNGNSEEGEIIFQAKGSERIV